MFKGADRRSTRQAPCKLHAAAVALAALLTLIGAVPAAGAAGRSFDDIRWLDGDGDRIADRLGRSVERSVALGDDELLPLIVRFERAPTRADEAAIEDLGGVVLDRWERVLTALYVALPADAVKACSGLPGVRFVDADYPGRATSVTATRQVGARDVWLGAGALLPYRGRAQHRIAVLDSGVDDSHTDIDMAAGGWRDFVQTGNTSPIDRLGHGTTVAGIAAGSGAAADANGFKITFSGLFPTPEGAEAVHTFPIRTGSGSGFIQGILTWAATSGSHRVTLRNASGGQISTNAGTAKPRTTSATVSNANSEAYQVGFASQTGDSANTAGTFYQGQVTTRYNAWDVNSLTSGVAPDAQVVGVRIVDDTGATSSTRIIAALEWVSNYRAALQIVVVNLSVTLDGGVIDANVDAAVNELVDEGVVVVVAAGNYPAGNGAWVDASPPADIWIASPGTAAKAITVGAVNHLDQTTFYTGVGHPSRAAKPDLVAPGGSQHVLGAAGTRGIVGADSNDQDAARNPTSGAWTFRADGWANDYTASYGTSYAAAVVSGAVALFADARGGWSWYEYKPADPLFAQAPLLAKALLTMTAHEVQVGETSASGLRVASPGPAGRAAALQDRIEGYGRLDVRGALEALTLPYDATDRTATLGDEPIERKTWARHVDLAASEQVTVTVAVAAGLDADVYLFDGVPTTNGYPVLRAWSAQAGLGLQESLNFTAPAGAEGTARYYLVVKWVSGQGNITVTATSPERCDGIDNDRDGQTDEAAGGGPLSEGCWEGSVFTRNVGTCIDGSRTCSNGAWGPCAGQVLPNGSAPFIGEYYNGMDFQANALQSFDQEAMLLFDGVTTGFGPGQDADFFSSRWRSQLCVNETGDYGLKIYADCRFSLSLALPGGVTTLIADDGDCQPSVQSTQATVHLNPGCVSLTATHRHGTGNATFRLYLIPPNTGGTEIPLTGVWTQKSPVLCDGVDDDCEGDPETADFPTLGQACDGDDVDECRLGTWTCRPNQLGVECVNETQSDILEDCNGLDDDCDGLTDESLTGGVLKRSCWEGPPSAAGTGECVAGEESCVATNWTGNCEGQTFPNGYPGFAVQYFSDRELTNLVAQDTKATVQETANLTGFHPLQPADDFSARWTTDFCVGVPGTYVFYGIADDGQRLHFDLGEGPFLVIDDWSENPSPVEQTGEVDLPAGCFPIVYEMFDHVEGAQAQLEFEGPGIARQLLAGPYAWVRVENACDSKDDDCDGRTDEGWALGEACDGDDKDVCENGLTICSADGTVVVCGPEDPADIDELCNDFDDDCDGETDEIFPLGDDCTVGVGECVRDGVYVCDEAQVGHVCSVVPGDPVDEICDGLDNDCDGFTDEDAEGAPLTVHCYEGPRGSEDVGICVGGTRTCADGAYGVCADQILPAGSQGWAVQWFANTTLSGDPVATGRVDFIDYDIGQAPPGVEGVPADGFSARFTSVLCVDAGGEYAFHGTSDDGQRLYLDLGEGAAAVIDNWVNQGAHEESAIVSLSAGCYDIWYEWYDGGGNAFALLEIESEVGAIERQRLGSPFVWEQDEALCDARDDDCDGDTDEQYELGVGCDGPDSDLCQNGVFVCAADGIGVVCGDEEPADIVEECNGLDDDCDGETDEFEPGVVLSRACYRGGEEAGVGICSEGISYCTDGEWAECLGDITPMSGFRAWFFEGASFDTLIDESVVSAIWYQDVEGGLVAGQEADVISARFETWVCVPADANYRFRATAEGGLRVSIDVGAGWLPVIRQWDDLDLRSSEFSLFLAAGCTPLRYEWFDLAGGRTAKLEVQLADSSWAPLDGAWTNRPNELCNGLDDDCDGETDESGLVDEGTGDPLPLTQACYEGPPVTLGQGICAAGEQVCADGAWDACDGDAPAVATPGFVVEWFDNPTLSGDPVVTTTAPFIDYHFGVDEAPAPGLPIDGWSARAETLLCIDGPVSTLQIVAAHDDGGRLWLDAGEGWVQLIDDWGPNSVRTIGTSDQALPRGCYPLRYEFWDSELEATARLEFDAPEISVQMGLLGWPYVWQLEEGACDAVDDDCDGRTDEEWAEMFVTACDGDDTDMCLNGFYVCAPDGNGVVCGTEEPADIEELCNGVDDDCDGDTDEAFELLGMDCDGDDADFCATGTWTCGPDELSYVCENETAGPFVESCDEVDNDCDGETDEDFTTLGDPCDGDDTDQCANGGYVCNAAGDGVTCGAEDPADLAEECNGFDDDCDGSTDEGLGITECGLGRCQHTIANCEDGSLQTCDPMEGAELEVCDGFDNDCDGETDEEDTGPLCVDDNGCTDDACNGFSLCTFTNNTLPCDDGDACTEGDTCAAGACGAGTAVTCEDDNVCTDDSCDSATGCVFTNNTAACDDDDACTDGDVCAGGTCGAGAAVDCDDDNVCTDDSCDSATGCVNTNNTAACDDADACTDGDVCADGACVPGDAVDCNDDNVCTDDSCDTATGCVNANNTADCDDGDACTDGDVCADGACVAGGALDCDDDNVCTDDSCDTASGCVNTDNTADCDDDDACTDGDVCAEGACVPGADVDCDDQDVCTADACDTATGCTHEAIDGCCENDADCTGDNEFCVVADNTCAPDICSECTDDADCGGEGDLCVELFSGNYCGRDCSGGEECAPGSTCTDLDDGSKQCLPEDGDCTCVDDATTDCHEGNVVSFSSCGQPGDIAEDCDGRGCRAGACCPTGTSLNENDACEALPVEPGPEPVAEGTDKPDAVSPDTGGGTGDGVSVDDSGGGGGTDTGGDGGGGGGGGGCHTTGGAPLPWAGFALLLLLGLALALRRRKA